MIEDQPEKVTIPLKMHIGAPSVPVVKEGDWVKAGQLIAKCPDGDTVLLCKNNVVVRFSHETPEVVEQWPSLAQFFVDAINDSD